MTPTELQFAALFSLLCQTKQLSGGSPGSQAAFLTTSRTLPQVSAVGPALQPALFLLEGEQDVMENAIALPKYELHSAAVMFFRNITGPTTVNATQLNNLRDAVIYQLREQTLATLPRSIAVWQPGATLALGVTVFDPAGHLQKITTAGTTGTIQPAFDDAGGTTLDGTAIWTDQGFAPVIPLLGGQRQQLGGVVYHARVKGRILVNEGLQNNQGALVFPISILSGM
jgi:hypothetical protein